MEEEGCKFTRKITSVYATTQKFVLVLIEMWSTTHDNTSNCIIRTQEYAVHTEQRALKKDLFFDFKLVVTKLERRIPRGARQDLTLRHRSIALECQ